jgi:hypothetical protein
MSGRSWVKARVSGWSGIAREAPRLAALASTAPPGIEAIAPFRLLSFHKAIDQSIFVVTYFMAIPFDPAKRDITLRERGIDFAADAEKVFAGRRSTATRRAMVNSGRSLADGSMDEW